MKTYSSLKIEKTIILGFLLLIAAGTLLLWAFNSRSPVPLNFLDALFTSTSAVCVTGLIVVDTGKDLTLVSQWVVMLLIQLGGLGVMTAATTTMVLLGHRIKIRERILFTGGLGIDTPSGAVKLIFRILFITLIIEAAAVIPLVFVLSRSMGASEALFHGIFHSVSAFCNAGFSTLPGGLEGFANQYILPGTVMILIVTGGLGFLVIGELWLHLTERTRLSPHAVLVLQVSSILILAGTVLFFLSDRTAGLSPLSLPLKVWNALFQSVTARTAGFNTIPLRAISSLGIFLLSLLMIIGASPGSTGGGIKTTTAGVLFFSSLSEIQGRRAVYRNRTIADENIRRALAISFLYLLTVLTGVILLSLFEELPFRTLLFEAISAMGTVGLSLGITPSLSPPGKIVIILLMFWGRVGILTFIFGMVSRDRTISKISYAETNIPVG
ncbi:MAG: TrkH family potassium uptake protein [Synergistaceae bacterium]|nr:TrkH family potassium uptake protein [Synergistaceae bacterium]